ncbi:MAG: TIR domain-containing protein [Anaerolineales bacterium]|nr:MAG: TIR domain-containing protein [Anaerolineales bacterium]
MERAVDHSCRILLVLTPAWVESEWTTFESLLIQTTDPVGRRQRMIPLLLKDCEPPHRIAMLTYADFRDCRKHNVQFERVRDAVGGKRRLPDLGQPLGRLLYKTADARPEIGKHILSFDALIAEKTEGFVGRQFVFDALDTFLAEEPYGYFVIRGDPGIGKTALMGQLVKTRKPVHHFNVVQQNIRTPEQFLANVCAQLIARYKLTDWTIPDEPMQDSTFLVQCLDAAAADPANRPLILALDALDEADWRLLPPRVNVHYLPPVLPKGVYIITSTRPDKKVPLEVVRRRDLDIEQDSEGNLLDIRIHLETYARRSGMQTWLDEWGIDAETFVIELLHKSQGNFMYLFYVLPAIEAGRMGRGGVGELPEGLQAYYRSHWAQMKEEIGGTFEETHERVICVLAVMTEPVSLDEVAGWTKLQRREVRRIIKAWEQFLLEDMVNGERLYQVYHTSFAEFLREQVDLRDYSELVASAIEEKVEQARQGR